MKGGDLYHKLKKEGNLPEDLVRFFAAQIAIALLIKLIILIQNINYSIKFLIFTLEKNIYK